MTKKDILIRYREIVIEIDTLERQAAFLNKYIGGPGPVRSVQLTGMPRGTNNPEAAMIQQVEEPDPALDIRLKSAELQNYLPEFNKIVGGIKDDRVRNIIRKYYALGETDWKIAKEYALTAKRIYQIRSDFLKTLD